MRNQGNPNLQLGQEERCFDSHNQITKSPEGHDCALIGDDENHGQGEQSKMADKHCACLLP